MNRSRPFLPYGKPTIEADDRAAVADALGSDMLTTGPRPAAFEAALAERLGAPHAVVCSNGTAALHLAALALGLGPGDCAVVPSLTFLATANSVAFTGARVVFADVDPQTGLMTPETAAAAVARSDGPVRALFPVHLNGQCCDMAGIAAVARRAGARIVEDACHAIGGAQTADPARWPDGLAPVGACAHSDMATFSFHPVKTITTTEGGAVLARDGDLTRRLRDFRNHGLIREAERFTNPDGFDGAGAPNPWFYEMQAPGYNYRLSDVQCALGISQLAKLDRFVARRAALVARYRERLGACALPLAPVPEVATGRPAWHLFAVAIDFEAAGASRAETMRALAAQGVGSQVHYYPVHRQPYYRALDPTLDLPGADRYYDRALSLPLFPAMTDADVDCVVDALAEALG